MAALVKSGPNTWITVGLLDEQYVFHWKPGDTGVIVTKQKGLAPHTLLPPWTHTEEEVILHIRHYLQRYGYEIDITAVD